VDTVHPVRDQELHAIAILCVQVTEAHGLSDKGRSGKAPKDEGHRVPSTQVREAHRIFATDVDTEHPVIVQLKVWSQLARPGGEQIAARVPSSGLVLALKGLGRPYGPCL